MNHELLTVEAELHDIAEKMRDTLRIAGKCVQATAYFHGIALKRAQILNEGNFCKWLDEQGLGFSRTESYRLMKFVDVIDRIISDNGKTPPVHERLLKCCGRELVGTVASELAETGVDLPQFLSHAIALSQMLDDREWAPVWQSLRKQGEVPTERSIKAEVCSKSGTQNLANNESVETIQFKRQSYEALRVEAVRLKQENAELRQKAMELEAGRNILEGEIQRLDGILKSIQTSITEGKAK